MKIINLLEDVAFEKATNRFLFVFQDFLLEQYPEFKTKFTISNKVTYGAGIKSIPKCIHWYVGRTIFIIDFTLWDNSFIEVCISTVLYNNKIIKVSSQLHVNFYTIEELTFKNFDIVSSINQLLQQNSNSPYAYALLKNVQQGKLDSLEQYLND